MDTISGRRASITQRCREKCVDVNSYWKSWPRLVPQHGPGQKHERTIELTDWQRPLGRAMAGAAASRPDPFGWLPLYKTGRCNWVCPRYRFTQVSSDIRGIFCDACDLIAASTRAGKRTSYVSRKGDVATLDSSSGRSDGPPPAVRGAGETALTASPSPPPPARPPPGCARRASASPTRGGCGPSRAIDRARRRCRRPSRARASREHLVLARGQRALALAERRRGEAGVDDALAGGGAADRARELAAGASLSRKPAAPPSIARRR